MKDLILNKIPHHLVDGFSLWRLGVYEDASFELVELDEGQIQPPHYHESSDATLRFVLGDGTIILNGEPQDYKAGDIFQVPRNTVHEFEARSHSLFLSIQNPPIRNQSTGVEDIVFINNMNKE